MKWKNKMGECETYFAEVNKCVTDNKNGRSFMLPEFALNLYMSSIAHSLAVIADKMCEEDEHA